MRRLEIKNFRGVDYSKDVTQLDVNQAAEMVNMELEGGSIHTYKGYKALFPTTNRISEHSSAKYIGYNPTANKIVTFFSEVSGGKLYTIGKYSNRNNHVLTELCAMSGTVEGQNASFSMRGYQYFLDGHGPVRWDGTNPVQTLESVAYIPTTVMGRAPAGDNASQTAHEERNLIGTGFKNSFSSDGIATVYVLNEDNLDATPVTVKVGVTDLTEGTHFTVDRAAGTINFAAGTTPHGAPVEGDADNVIITAYKNKNMQYRITSCRKAVLYGSGNDSRVFLYDSVYNSNFVFWSNVYDPTYFPELNCNEIGDKTNPITGIAKQFDSMVVVKSSSNNDSTIWIMRQEFDDNGIARFPVTQGISGTGCDAANTLQVIEDKPTFLSSTGVYRITGTNVKDERTLEHISLPIDKELSKIRVDKRTLSFDHDNKYGISWYNTIYIFDYNLKYIKNNIVHYECYMLNLPSVITSFAVIDEVLYIGCNNGLIYTQNRPGDTKIYYHTEYGWIDGFYGETSTPVASTWNLPLLNYDSDTKFKHLHKINVNASTKTSDGLFSLYSNSQKANSLDFNRIAVNQGWLTPSENETYTIKNCVIDVNERDVLKHQLSFRTSKDIAIMSVTIYFSYGREYKGW